MQEKTCGHQHCTLTTLFCCVCSDKRPLQPNYTQYVDGKGYVNTASRAEFYCSKCKHEYPYEPFLEEKEQSGINCTQNCADPKVLHLPPPKKLYDPLTLRLGGEVFKLILDHMDPTLRYFLMFTCSPWYYLVRASAKIFIPSPTHLAQTAAENGYSGLLQVMKEMGYNLNAKTCAHAARGGHLATLKYLHEDVGCKWDAQTYAGAALGGHKDCFEYAFKNKCLWDESACAAAASGGHLELLQYAHENGFEWDEKTCDNAAKGGHLEVLQYALDEGCSWSSAGWIEAAKGGHVGCFKLLYSYGESTIDFKAMCIASRNAAQGGHWECLQFMQENDMEIAADVLQSAALGGKLECIEKLIDIGYNADLATISAAAKGGHIGVIKYLRDKGVSWDTTVLQSAAREGHIECLKYLHENGLLCTPQVVHYSACGNSLECLKFAIENCTCSIEEMEGYTGHLIYTLASSGTLERVKYAREKGFLWDRRACSAAATEFEMLKYLHENGCPWDASTCSWAAYWDNVKCLQYAHENGCPWDETTTRNAFDHGNFSCLKYALENGCPVNKDLVNFRLGKWFTYNAQCVEFLREWTKNNK